MIKKAFANSWMTLKEHPKLFVPDFLYRIFVIALSFYFAADFAVLANVANAETFIIEDFLTENVLNSIYFVGFFVIAQFLIGVAVEAIRYGMINDVIKKKKSLLGMFRTYIKDNYFRILKLKMIVGLIMLIAACLIFLIVLPLNFTVLKESLTITFVGLAGLVYVLMSLALFFRYPIMIMDNKSAWASIVDSYKFFRKNMQYTLITGVISSLVAGVSIFGARLAVVSVGINLLVTVWISLFVFNSYHLKRKS